MRHIPGTPDHELEFVGGALCLDFTNTLGGTRERPTHDHVRTYADLVAFARAALAIAPADAKRLVAEAERHPNVAMEMYRRGVALREAVSRAFGSIAAGHAPDDADLARIGEEAADAQAHARLVRGRSGYEWSWSNDDPSLARPLWAIARSAADLLIDGSDRERVRECSSPTCTWLFVDRSRNHSRRWCDMNDCGNRAKQRRLRQRRGPSPSRAAP